MRIFPAKLAVELSGRFLRLARTEAVPLVAIAVLTASIALFLRLVDEVILEGEGRSFDAAVLAALRVPGHPELAIGPPWLREVARDLTALGSTAVLTVVAVIVTGFVLLQRQRAAAALFLGSLIGGVALSEGLKSVFERERPEAHYRLVETLHSSFPSGHSMLSAVAYLTLGALMARVLPKKRLKAYVLSVAVALTAIVGVTRVYLGAHWATDVVAGWAVGAAWATACWLASFALERLTHKPMEAPASHIQGKA